METIKAEDGLSGKITIAKLLTFYSGLINNSETLLSGC